MGLGVARLEADRLAQRGDGLVELSLLCECGTQVGMSQGGAGVQPDCVAIPDDRLVQLSLLYQCVAEGELGVRVVGIEPGCLAAFGDGLVRLFLADKARPRYRWPCELPGLSRVASR